MNLKEISKQGTTLKRKEFWDAARAAVLSEQKLAGHSVTVSEFPGKGTVINVERPRGEFPLELGACCFLDGFCADFTTEESCGEAGGFFQGAGTNCETPGLCLGACCHPVGPDAVCDDDFGPSVCENDFYNGLFLGFGSHCESIACSEHFGACCFCIDDIPSCTITSESDCTDAGGSYLGNESACGPEACPGCNCGFQGLVDTSTYFLTRTTTITRSDGSPIEEPCCCEFGCTSSWSLTTTEFYGFAADCECTAKSVSCSGSGTLTDCGGTTVNCDWVPGGLGGFCIDSGCTSGEGCSIFSNTCDVSCQNCGSSTTVTILDNTHLHAHCRFDSDITPGAFSELTIDTVLSDQVCTPI